MPRNLEPNGMPIITNDQLIAAVNEMTMQQIDDLCASSIIMPIDYNNDDTETAGYEDDIYSDALNQLN